MRSKEHPFLPTLRTLFTERRIDRREFLRTATLLGVSATAAYGFIGSVAGQGLAAAADMPRGGRLRIGMRVHDVRDPHTISWVEGSNVVRQVCDYLTRTGHDNITRPCLLERWEPSEDLRTWTLSLRRDVKWRKGRPFVADDVVWNLRRVLDEKTGSSVLGLMKGYMLEEYETGGTDADGNPKTATRLWDANAIEKLDDHTVRLNCKKPQLAVPEHLFHYPLAILDPEEDGVFQVGSNGTGPFELVEHEVSRRALLKARANYWGEGPYLDTLEVIDLGDDPAVAVSALASRQVDGLYEVDVAQLPAVKALDYVEIYTATTAQTGVARMKCTMKPFDDPRVRMAFRLAIDQNQILQIGVRGRGDVAEHHHVCPIHPEYAKLPMFSRDVERAKALLAEAGYPNGLDVEIACKSQPAWEAITVQAMVEQWEDAGIRCKVNLMPGALYWDVWTKVPFGFTTWAHRPLGVMTLGLAYRTGVPWNESSYSNPEFDKLLTKAEGILDPDKRRVVMTDLERILQEDGPIVQPLWRGIQTGFSKRVKGFREHPTQYIFAEQLAIEPA